VIDPQALIQARECGEIRYAVIFEGSGEIARVLSMFGLRAEPEALIEHSREVARRILQELLWKDMACERECMPQAQAESLADQILQQHAVEGSRFYSNRRGRSGSWHPLTDSTFDGGILIGDPEGLWFCLWFQDED
jgi:hypothetical protein